MPPPRPRTKYDEGIAILSLHSLGNTNTFDLPSGVFPRKALFTSIDVEGQVLEFEATGIYASDHIAVSAEFLLSL